MQNIPLAVYDYLVNGKPALEWVMERQVVKTDKANGIISDANDYAKEAVGTGRHTRRPGFQAMKAAIDRREVDVVVVEAIDRLSRSIRDSLEHFELLGFHGVLLYSVTEGRQDFFKVLVGAMGAQLYSESVSKHTWRGMQGAIARGRLGATPYGYRRRDAEAGLNRKIAPETAPVVRRIFEEVAAGKS